MPDAPAGGLQRNYILRACEASLRRLDTDYIDCYLCHFPDPDTPLRRDAVGVRPPGDRGQGALPGG